MTRAKLFSFLLFLVLLVVLLVKQTQAAEIMIGELQVNFINNKEIPSRVSVAIQRYKDELTFTNNIMLLKEKLQNIILTQAYYDVDIQIKNDKNLIVELGDYYKIKKINYYVNNVLIKTDNSLTLVSNILAENIELAKKKYLNLTSKERCIFKHYGDVKIDLDKKNKLFVINYYINGLEYSKFGHVRLNTNNKIDKKFIQKKLTFAEGQCYKFNRVDNSKFNLFSTSLFSEIKISQNQRDQSNIIDIDIETDIKNSKKLESMLEFSSEDKMGGSFNFNNKNFRSKGEKLNIFLSVSKNDKETYIEHVSSSNLITNKINYTIENNNLRQKKKIEYFFNKTHKINNIKSISAGFSAKQSNLLFDNKINQEKTIILSLPISYEIKNKKDDNHYTNHAILLNLLTSKKSNIFYKTGYRHQKYFRLHHKKNLFISLDASINKIHGSNIPLTEKMYLGGMNSIRGYEYETVGVFENNKNVPAVNSYFIKTEISYRANNNWGTGIFYDIGRASNKELFKINNLIDSAGFSIKYYINNLPISFDLAFPLKKKYSGKNKYEFYLNMGFNF